MSRGVSKGPDFGFDLEREGGEEGRRDQVSSDEGTERNAWSVRAEELKDGITKPFSSCGSRFKQQGRDLVTDKLRMERYEDVELDGRSVELTSSSSLRSSSRSSLPTFLRACNSMQSLAMWTFSDDPPPL